MKFKMEMGANARSADGPVKPCRKQVMINSYLSDRLPPRAWAENG